jgi:hypothetical protein
VELWRGNSQAIACIAADDGRVSTVDHIDDLLADGYRVLAVDPFYLGESKLEQRGYLFALLVSSVGARPMGVQADQLQAVSRWAKAQFGSAVERQVAVGPRISLSALIAVATAEDDERPHELVLHDSLGSHRQIIDNNWSVDEYPELFCFGLLEHCEMTDLLELAKPCSVTRK